MIGAFLLLFGAAEAGPARTPREGYFSLDGVQFASCEACLRNRGEYLIVLDLKTLESLKAIRL